MSKTGRPPGAMNEVELLRRVRQRDDDVAAAEAVARERLQAAIAAERDPSGGPLRARVRAWWEHRLPAVPGFSLGAVATAAIALVVMTIQRRSRRSASDPP